MKAMVRCTKCRFLFEPPTPGLLPECRQCGGATIAVLKIEPSDDLLPPAQPTFKFAAVKTDAPSR
jgi:hypothetical protein